MVAVWRCNDLALTVHPVIIYSINTVLFIPIQDKAPEGCIPATCHLMLYIIRVVQP
jgi:hypothetical protein